MSQSAFKRILTQLCRTVMAVQSPSVPKQLAENVTLILHSCFRLCVEGLAGILLSPSAREYIADAMALLLDVPIICRLSLWQLRTNPCQTESVFLPGSRPAAFLHF